MAEKGPGQIHSGHRARMQERVRAYGLESLQPHEVLEYLLFFCIPQKNTNPLAHTLIEHFGGFCQVLEASEEELQQVRGIGPASARLLHSYIEVFRCYEVLKRRPRKALADHRDAVEYVKPLFLGLQEEVFYLIAMDDRRNPLRDIRVASGLPNKVSFDMQALARSAVESRCTCALLAHNHPTGLAIPSNEDLEVTSRIESLLRSLGIILLDHIIVTPDDAASLRSIKRMPPL